MAKQYAKDAMTRRAWTRRQFLLAGLQATVGAIAAEKGGKAWAMRVEPDWVQTEHVTLTLPRLSPAFDGFRLAQLSDIHMDSEPGSTDGWMNWERLLRVVEKVNAENVDLVAITGDFITAHPDAAERFSPPLIQVLSKLKAREGVVGVLGNHDYLGNDDYRADGTRMSQTLRDCGIRELANAVLTLRRERETLHICGCDDWWAAKADLPAVMKKLPASGAAVLLIHEPDFADLSAATGRFDLQISGHSHGGQICAPFFGPAILPLLGAKYSSGFYRVGNMIQYTNRGLGMISPRVRFNCRPEITIFTLRSPLV